MDDQNKNLILATALSFLVILAWFVLFPPPPVEDAVEPDVVVAADGTVLEVEADAPDDVPNPSLLAPEAVEDAIGQTERVAIDSPSLTGSLSLMGGRIDDLSLKGYRETLEPDADLVRLLAPVGTAAPYYALHGWVPSVGATREQVPGPSTQWTVESGESLSPGSDVTLAWDNGAGLTFRKTFSVDDEFLFTVTQSVENTTGSEVALRPYGIVARHGEPDQIGFFIQHEGVVRMSDGSMEEIDYDDMPDLTTEEGRVEVAENGWIGFSDQYWMTALIPTPGREFRSTAKSVNDIYQIETVYPMMTVPAGETLAASSAFFAGAQEWEVIRSYQNDLGIDRFLDSIDWGWFFFLTKPIFAVLHWLNGLIGNMGWSIIALTFLIKALLLPLAYKSYVSMAKMRELQPEMQKLKESAGDDREKLQKGMMALYKDNKVNPASGCLPILMQIPIFFSLYKVIFVTIELRHAPWIGWINDLSAPDPSSLFNLFGLLPWDAPAPESFLSLVFIGVMPIVLGVSMWLQQKLNPAPTDPTQKMIFAWMPWVFMFMLGSFASGLVLYWIANNTITFMQQYAIMRSQGFKPDLFGNITGRRKPDAE
ncbi:membrane protein insertase YidC [Thalassorhabdomicrobium marinisediminis]|uniref:Membrane protein insertase YidC n=1 Tax=Thalassorhabdomicrobium marinisediminis TaxID=2170577 RepID=A0A2T7FWB9_9RHOB|nr:membrane protein insertase YidC [Thalassorhabdomicrobium marinisediminis]PVA06466.1 membrane protein insertase YidC [Thalassorhabdomicrobium marinisediminis]